MMSESKEVNFTVSNNGYVINQDRYEIDFNAVYDLDDVIRLLKALDIQMDQSVVDKHNIHDLVKEI